MTKKPSVRVQNQKKETILYKFEEILKISVSCFVLIQGLKILLKPLFKSEKASLFLPKGCKECNIALLERQQK